MSELLEKQFRFSVMQAKLVLHAVAIGLQVTMDEMYRPPETCELYAKKGIGIKNSNHQRRIAMDINLFEAGEFLTEPDRYLDLHVMWSSFGGADPIEGDARHFSLEHDGVR
jgi:hypothetical protein